MDIHDDKTKSQKLSPKKAIKKKKKKRKAPKAMLQMSIRYNMTLMRLAMLIIVLTSFVFGVRLCISKVHIYGDEEIKAATCSELGYKEEICMICGKVSRSDYTSGSDHIYSDEPIVKYNRFLEYEEIYYECIKCGELSEPVVYSE